ncbi:uncharacterized protein F5147DRAFT_782874 [Suillus discolor]|uniref:Importin subunit beta-1/Transportin-1-like TPR repeats domain-containing protein n=1 Tax=Suillus discolor TaxID=1912936 RepID=A0A9P7ERM2_9AGAM|nr:uncharacterized protein F5147DRAFT_782874 [Suillus discolor]KAG2083552.1 hypothetical protein F5147DRAFT_782874 [Suillus discolor]
MPITLDSGTRHFMSTLSNLTLNHIRLSTASDMTSIEITQRLFGNSLKTSVIGYLCFRPHPISIPSTCVTVGRSSNHLRQTLSVQPNPLKFDLIKYVAQLREGILETYTVVVTAFKNTQRAPALLPYMPSLSSSINV